LENNNSQNFLVDAKNRKTCDREQFKIWREEKLKDLELKYDLKTLGLRNDIETVDREGVEFEQFMHRWQKKLKTLESKKETLESEKEIIDLKKEISNLKSDLKTLKLNKDPKDVDRKAVNRYLNRYFREYNKKK
jgi:hypothetical protein